MDGIEIAIKLEEELDIKIEDNGLTKNTTIREVIAYLQTKFEKVEIK